MLLQWPNYAPQSQNCPCHLLLITSKGKTHFWRHRKSIIV